MRNNINESKTSLKLEGIYQEYKNLAEKNNSANEHITEPESVAPTLRERQILHDPITQRF